MIFYYGPTPTAVAAEEIISISDPQVTLDNTPSITVTLRQYEGDKYATFANVQNQFGGLRDNDTSTIWYFAGRIGTVQFPTPTTVVIMIEGESSKLGDKPCPGQPTVLGTFTGNYDLLTVRNFAKQRVKGVLAWGLTDVITVENDDDSAGDPGFAEDEWNGGPQDCGAILTDTTTNLSKTWALTTVLDGGVPYAPDSISPDPHVPANANTANNDLYVGWRAASSAKVIRTRLTLDGDDIAKTNSGVKVTLRWQFRIGVRWTDATHKSFLNHMKLYLHSNGMYNETFDGENYLLVGTCGAVNPVDGEAVHYEVWPDEKVLDGSWFTELLRSDADHWEDEYAYLVIDTSTLNNTQVDIDLDYIALILEYRTSDFTPIMAQITDSGGNNLEVGAEDFEDQTLDAFPADTNGLDWTDVTAGPTAVTTVKAGFVSGQELRLHSEANGDTPDARVEFGPIVDDGYVEFRVRWTGGLPAQTNLLINLADATGGAYITSLAFYKVDDHIWAHNLTHDLGAFVNETDYLIRITWDWSASTYTISIGGAPVLVDHAFQHAPVNVSKIQFQSQAVGAETINIYVNDLVVVAHPTTSWIRCPSVNFYTLGVSAGDKVKVGQNTRTVALGVGSFCGVVVDPDPLFVKYIATNYKGSNGRTVIQRVCDLEQAHWWDAWTTSGSPRVALRKTSSFEASAYTSGAGLTSAHFHKNFDIQRPMNRYLAVEGWGNAEHEIHWLEMDTADDNDSPLIDPIVDDAIMTTGDMRALCYAKLQELKVLRPSIKVVLEAKYGDANYANYAALTPGQKAYATFERPTIAETEYVIRRVDRHQTHPNGKMVTTVYLGLGLTPPEEEFGRVVGKLIREVASARASLVSPRVLGDLSLYLKIDGSRAMTGSLTLGGPLGWNGHGATKPMVRAYRATSNQANVAAGDTVIFNTESYDIGSNYAIATGIFTTPNAGYYRVHARVTFSDADAAHSFGLTISADGTVVSYTNQYSRAGWSTFEISDTIYLAAAKEIKILTNYGAAGVHTVLGTSGQGETVLTIEQEA